MLDKLKTIFGASTTRPIFIIGTGRAGTHWIGYSLGNHPEVRATIEVEPMFGWSTRMALDPGLEGRLFGRLVLEYRWQLFKSAPRLYLDKSHPNIWIAEKLKKAFPRALFVGIERNPYATVASMLKKKGLGWQKRWREFPVPNRFLGISTETAKVYDDMPVAGQSAMRWVAHHERMQALKSPLADSLMVISYETFAHQPESTLHDLQLFLELDTPIPVPDVKTESLEKWKNQLSPDELKQIQAVVGFPPDDVDD